MHIKRMVERLIELRQQGINITLLALCPTSEAVLEAAVIAAKRHNTPILLAATLNQVDRDGGYTGWTPADLMQRIHHYTDKHNLDKRLVLPCLDHGGPWKKDTHVRDKLDFATTWREVQESITEVLRVGYQLLHIDTTVNPDQPINLDWIVEHTIRLIAYAESERKRLGLPPISYEVGTDEVHGGLTEPAVVQDFLRKLHQGLAEQQLTDAHIAFVVADVGTNLHTTEFDQAAAQQLYQIASPYKILAKGHYTDGVAHPEAYPECGMGGANVGPELTAVEVDVLLDLKQWEETNLIAHPHPPASEFSRVLITAIDRSNRWQKWRLPDEQGKTLDALTPERRRWIIETCARYVLATPEVEAARQQLYQNLRPIIHEPHQIVVGRVTELIEHYITAFNLANSAVYFAAPDNLSKP